jgi:RND family efflux transporter MFP subunit
MYKAITLAVIALFMNGCAEEAPLPPPAIQPAKVITVGEEFKIVREIPGTVRSAQRSDLAFQVPGQIVEFVVKEGQQVAAGELLARLDESDYKSNADAARAERDKNQSNFTRAEELIVGSFISQSDYDQIKAAYNVTTANLQQAEKALADTRLVAPFSGVVARTFVENFEDVQAKQAILSLQNPDALEIVVNISETMVARRDERAELEMYARMDSLPDRKFALFIKEFSAEADPKTQTFEAVVGIADDNVTNILPGMTTIVNVSRTDLVGDNQPLLIPLAAVVAGEGDASAVWKVDEDNKVHRQIVATGELVGTDQIQIISGLEIDDVIVTAGLSALVDDKQIIPITKVAY